MSPLKSPIDSPTSAFAVPNFRRFLAVRVAAMFANQIQVVCLGWQVYALTHSAFDLGLVGLFQFLPTVLLMLPAGHLADQADRRRVSQAGVLLKTLAVLLLFGLSAKDELSRLAIFLVAGLLGSARAFEMPANGALLPSLVPAALLPRALATSSSGTEIAVIFGPALGGLLYGLGPTVAYAICTLVYCGCLMGLGRIDLSQVSRGARVAATTQSVLAGIRFILSRRDLLGAISLDLFAVLFGGASALLPVYARDILHTGPLGVGLLRSAEAIGALIASLLLIRFPLKRKVGLRMFAAVAVFGLATVVFGLSRQLWLSLCALALLGMSDMVSVVVRSALIQLDTPDHMRGRVGAVNALFIGTSNQLGEFESGVTAALFGAVTAVVAGGLATLAVALLWMRWFPGLTRRDQLQALSDSAGDALGPVEVSPKDGKSDQNRESADPDV